MEKRWDDVGSGRQSGGAAGYGGEPQPINRLRARCPYLVTADIFCVGKALAAAGSYSPLSLSLSLVQSRSLALAVLNGDN